MCIPIIKLIERLASKARQNVSKSKENNRGVQRQGGQQNPAPYTQSQQQGAAEGLQDEHFTTQQPPAAPPAQADSKKATSADTKAAGVKAGNKMASDEDYAAFLERANQDPGEGFVNTDAATKKKKGFELRATDQGEVPAVLRSKRVADAFYVSDSDEPFEPVSLALPSDTKTLPDEVAFAKLVDHPEPTSARVEILDIGEWDAQGQYKDVVDAIREATEGSDVRIYRVGRDGARVEYWVVGVKDGRLLGVRTLAIES